MSGIDYPTITDEMIEQGKKGVAARLRWASIHWGAEGLHADAIPHIARAALEAAAPLIAAQALREAATRHTVRIPDALGYTVEAVFMETLLDEADRVEHAATSDGREASRDR